MKKIIISILVILLQQIVPAQTKVICITGHQTTALSFPHRIVAADRGSKFILLQKAKGTDHVLLAKAAVPDFTGSNLTIVTAEGSIYSFIVQYCASPDTLLYRFGPSMQPAANHYQHPTTKHLATIESLDGLLLQRKSKRHRLAIRVHGIYVQEDVIYFHVGLQNDSPIHFQSAGLQLQLKDRKRRKRTAKQDIRLTPVAETGDLQLVKGESVSKVVIAVPAFTIPIQKKLLLQVTERQGGRQISIKVPASVLLKATPLR